MHVNLLLLDKGKTGSLAAEAARALAVHRLHEIFFGELDLSVFAKFGGYWL